MDVGFYSMVNVGGRLSGTVVSGALDQWQGLEACLWASVAFVLAAALLSVLLPTASAPARARGERRDRDSAVRQVARRADGHRTPLPVRR